MIQLAPFLPTRPDQADLFSDATTAVARIRHIYDANIAYLRDSFRRLVRGDSLPDRVRACYPYVAITTTTAAMIDTRLSFGFVSGPGRYSTTLTRPDIFENYYREQLTHLLANHQVALEVGVSETPIPIHFVFYDGQHVEGDLDQTKIEMMRSRFDLPDLSVMDDSIANGTYRTQAGQEKPLSMFTAPRVDYSLLRLRHYTGTDPSAFQNFVIFTNYQFYVDAFVRYAHDVLASPGPHGYTGLIEPPAGQSQMPAYHLTRADGTGITIVDIGVGPSNARNISDHIAVLRPDAWIMLGHCAGLRKTQKLGDYVLAHGYVRDDHALDDELPLWVPVPALAEIQLALQNAVGKVLGVGGYARKAVMRTGTVVTTDNRNWEISGYDCLVERFSQSRAIALDMESAVVAANGFRFRVPYGTLLCVSDRPLHGEIKLPGMANSFYRQQVSQHLAIGVRAMELLREEGPETLHSRKLRSFAETAFK